MKTPQELYIVYEIGHLEDVRAQIACGKAIVCLDFWAELELRNQNVAFIPLKDFIDPDRTEEEWWLLAQGVAREWYRLPVIRFFEYEGIRIGEALEPIMETYLSRLFYYVRIYTALKKKFPDAPIHIKTPLVDDAATGGGLITFERLAIVDAARVAGIESVVSGIRPKSPRGHLFPRTVLKSLLVHIYNGLVSLAPRRGLKIYASEYWSHIGLIVEKMEDTELVLMEFSELKHIPWRQILKHRIRIQHPADTIHGALERDATRVGSTFIEEWRSARGGVAAYLTNARGDLDWSPVLEALEYIVQYSPRVVADIDALERIMKKEKPAVVLQLASVGGRRHHFFLMARIAEKLHIPTIELQHAGAVFNPNSPFSRLETSYLAAYGDVEREQYGQNGYAPERILAIGSPRFDDYLQNIERFTRLRAQTLTQLGLDPSRRVVMVALPALQINLSSIGFSSYDAATLFQDAQQVRQLIPDVQFIFKFRKRNCTEQQRTYLKQLFPEGGIAITDDDLHPFICASDCVLSGDSTVMYETMLARRPLVLYPWKGWDYHLDIYSPVAPYVSGKDLPALIQKIFSDSSYTRELLAREERFMARHAFDGRATERMIALLREKSS
jgi:hypothetical protein